MTDEDLPFSASLYASTRAGELAQAGLPPEHLGAFLAQQHDAQHRHYRGHYPGAEWLIIEQEDEAIGRLYLVEWESEFRVIDISLLPDARGKGVGGALIGDLIEAAHAVAKKVSIHVERNNPAIRLYERLGFELAEDRGVYLLMERPAAGPQAF